MAASSPLEAIAAFVTQLRSSAHELVAPTPDFVDGVRSGVKLLYDTSARLHFGDGYASLPQLHVGRGWDADALWGEIAHTHRPALRETTRALKQLKASLQKSKARGGGRGDRAAATRRTARAVRGRDDEDEDDDQDDAQDEADDVARTAGASNRRGGKSTSSRAARAGTDVDLEDMEAFVSEGDAYWQRVTGDGADEEDDDGEDEDEDGRAEGDVTGPVSFADIDMNTPIDDPTGDAPGPAARNSDKQARIRQLLSSAVTAKDFFGDSAAGARQRRRAGPAADEDDDEAESGMEDEDDEDAADEGGEKNDAGTDEGDSDAEHEHDGENDSMLSGGSGDAFIDAGLGVESDAGGDEESGDEEDTLRARGKRRREVDDDDEQVTTKKRAEYDGSVSGGSDTDAQPAAVRTRHQREKESIAEQIAALEREALATKSWELQGEVTAQKRPENSLLGVHLDYEQAMKLAPVVTVESTANLEDIIKQRIADAAWDDRAPIVDAGAKSKKAAKTDVELSTEASKKGLAEVYEAEYQAALTAAVAPAPAAGAVETAAPADKKAALTAAEREVVGLAARLFAKLDALSNFHFAPKMVIPEAQVTSNLPSIAMEEVLPMGVSTAATRAPEEVFAPATAGSVLQSKGEMTAEQRAAARRAAKEAGRKAKRADVAGARKAAGGEPKLGRNAAGTTVVLGGGKRVGKRGPGGIPSEPASGVAASVPGASVRDSTALFRQLQDEARRSIYGDAPTKNAAPRITASTASAAAKFKL